MAGSCDRMVSRTLEVRSELARLGLESEWIQDAVKHAWLNRIECTANDPISFAGTVLWARCIRGLREQLRSQGWVKRDENGVPLVVSPSGALAITVATGDDGTGRLHLSTTTKNSKGRTLASAILGNQGRIFPEFWGGDDEPEERPSYETWLLLLHCEDTYSEGVLEESEVRMELSLPQVMNKEGFVKWWSERIMLPPLRFGGPGAIDTMDEEQEESVDIEIKRRGE